MGKVKVHDPDPTLGNPHSCVMSNKQKTVTFLSASTSWLLDKINPIWSLIHKRFFSSSNWWGFIIIVVFFHIIIIVVLVLFRAICAKKCIFWWPMATHRSPIKYQFPPDRPTLCVAPESRSKDPCFSLVSPPFLAIGAMQQVHEYSQVTLVKRLPPGPIKRAKKSKKLNPKWEEWSEGIFVSRPFSQWNHPFAQPTNGIRPPKVTSHSLLEADHQQPLPSDSVFFPLFCYFHLSMNYQRGN